MTSANYGESCRFASDPNLNWYQTFSIVYLQVHGLGTALKILFSGMFDENNPEQYIHAQRKDFQLKRTEIVSLLNSIGRLSTSIYELDEFRKILR